MISLLAPLPLLLYKIRLFQKKEFGWLPTLITFLIYVFHLQKLGSLKSLEPSLYLALVFSVVAYLAISLLEKRVPNLNVIQLTITHVGFYFFSENLIGILPLVLYFWVSTLNSNPKTFFERSFNFSVPLIYGFMSMWKKYFLNDLDYFLNLYKLTANHAAIDVMLITYLILCGIVLLAFSDAAKNFVMLNKGESFLKLISSTLFLFALKQGFSDFQYYFDVLMLVFSLMFFWKVENSIYKFLTLIIAASLINISSGYLVVFIVPLFSPFLVSRVSSLLRQSGYTTSLPLLVVPVGIIMTLSSSISVLGKTVVLLLILSCLVGQKSEQVFNKGSNI